MNELTILENYRTQEIPPLLSVNGTRVFKCTCSAYNNQNQDKHKTCKKCTNIYNEKKTIKNPKKACTVNRCSRSPNLQTAIQASNWLVVADEPDFRIDWYQQSKNHREETVICKSPSPGQLKKFNPNQTFTYEYIFISYIFIKLSYYLLFELRCINIVI